MDTNTQTPVTPDVSTEGQVAPDVTPEVTPVVDGQGTGEPAQSPQQPAPFETRFNEFVTKKGWDPAKGTEQLLTSYEELESKLGNWNEVESKAKWLDENRESLITLQEKARMWEEAEQARQAEALATGTFDYSQAPTKDLALMWKNGQLSLADLPPQRQYEVQKFAAAEDLAFETQNREQAQQLVQNNPILKNPEVRNIVADYIEKGMDPNEAVTKVKSLFSEFEKQGEERIKKNIELLKNGNLERTTSAAPTKPNRVINSVRDAFMSAKDDLAG